MIAFRPTLPPTVTGLVWISLAVALLVADLKVDLSPLREGIALLLYPLEITVDRSVKALRTVPLWFRERERLVLENRALKREVARLRAKVLREEALFEENRRLRTRLYGRPPVRERWIPAEILAISGGGHRVVVGRGRKDGIRPGMPALTAEGIAGQVVRVFSRTAEVVLISDPNHALWVSVKRSGLRALLVGEGRFLRLLHLPETADIREGDLLLASGLGGIFPKRYPVARVVRVERGKEGLFTEAIALPLAPLDRLEDLFLLDIQQDRRGLGLSD